MNKGGFSWKMLLGITETKRKISEVEKMGYSACKKCGGI